MIWESSYNNPSESSNSFTYTCVLIVGAYFVKTSTSLATSKNAKMEVPPQFSLLMTFHFWKNDKIIVHFVETNLSTYDKI